MKGAHIDTKCVWSADATYTCPGQGAMPSQQQQVQQPQKQAGGAGPWQQQQQQGGASPSPVGPLTQGPTPPPFIFQ